jgi:hypothetical protein
LGKEWGAARDGNTPSRREEEGVIEALEKMIRLLKKTVLYKSRVQVKERGGDNVGGASKLVMFGINKAEQLEVARLRATTLRQPVASILCISLTFYPTLHREPPTLLDITRLHDKFLSIALWYHDIALSTVRTPQHMPFLI